MSRRIQVCNISEWWMHHKYIGQNVCEHHCSKFSLTKKLENTKINSIINSTCYMSYNFKLSFLNNKSSSYEYKIIFKVKLIVIGLIE